LGDSHTVDPKILGAVVQHLVAWASWLPGNVLSTIKRYSPFGQFSVFNRRYALVWCRNTIERKALSLL